MTEPEQPKTKPKKPRTPKAPPPAPRALPWPERCDALGNEVAFKPRASEEVCTLECCPQKCRLLHHFGTSHAA